jgi:phosphoglycerate dehydrogenase-like enzyme
VLYGIPRERPSLLKPVLDANPRLRWVHTTPAGGGSQVKAAHLSEEQLERVVFTTSAGVHVEPLAEFSLFGLLAGLKTLPRLQEHQRRHDWARERWTMRLLGDSAVLVVGLGHIGRTTARKLAVLGARVAGTSRRDVQVEGVDEVIHPDALADRIGEFDGIVVTLPGTDLTHHLVSAEVLAAAKPGAVIVNVGRGTVIDEAALVRELQAGRIAYAALDVVEQEPLDPGSPLWDLPNVLISPHTAAMHEREDRLIADLFAENATRFLDGRELINRVDTVEFY